MVGLLAGRTGIDILRLPGICLRGASVAVQGEHGDRWRLERLELAWTGDCGFDGATKFSGVTRERAPDAAPSGIGALGGSADDFGVHVRGFGGAMRRRN